MMSDDVVVVYFREPKRTRVSSNNNHRAKKVKKHTKSSEKAGKMERNIQFQKHATFHRNRISSYLLTVEINLLRSNSIVVTLVEIKRNMILN